MLLSPDVSLALGDLLVVAGMTLSERGDRGFLGEALAPPGVGGLTWPITTQCTVKNGTKW